MKKFLIYGSLTIIVAACIERKAVDTAKDPVLRDSSSHGVSTSLPDPPKPIEKMTREERSLYKDQLSQKGFYDCCIKPSCNMCFYEEGSECHCGEHIKNDEGVCGECFRGWQKGLGSVKNIDPKKIRRM